MRLALTAVAAVAACIATPAGATIIIGTGAGTVQPDENVLFTNNPADGLSILGITNDTNSLVLLSGGEALHGNGGQARLQAVSGGIDTTFTYGGTAGQLVGFDLNDATLGFKSAEFKIFGGTATQLTVTAFDTTGTSFSSTVSLPPSGFVYLNTADNQVIDRFSFSANGSVGDVRQIRIGGIATIGGGGGVDAVPEPATWAMMIMGFGGAGAMLRRRRTAGAHA